MFFLLLFILSIPFWLMGALIPRELAPGLPVSALMAICPMLAGLILTRRESGRGASWALVKRAFDYRRIPRVWYLPIFLLKPGMLALAYLVMQMLGFPLPAPGFPLLTLALLVFVFLLMGIGEEVGWMGYAIDRLQRRWSALSSALLIGVVWGVWHIIPLVQAHRAPGWIAWWFLGTVASRVLIVWIYNNTNGSVLSSVLTHAVDNLSWMLFPNLGSHYDPAIISPIIAGGALVVVAVWGPRTLTRGRRGSEPPL